LLAGAEVGLELAGELGQLALEAAGLEVVVKGVDHAAASTRGGERSASAEETAL
jgi:hypothetical protein